MDVMELNDRVAWVLGKIKEKNKLTNITLGEVLDIDKNTVQSYCHGKGNLKGSVLAVIVKNYGINGEWLMSGAGEPFSGAAEKFPEICGPPGFTRKQYDQITESVHHHIKEAQIQYNSNPDALFKSDQIINIEEAIGKAYKVLADGSALSVALYMNIQQFAAARETGRELQECKELVKGMQSQIDELTAKVDRLSSRPTSTEGQGDASESEKVA